MNIQTYFGNPNNGSNEMERLGEETWYSLINLNICFAMRDFKERI
jgi:hypothetical protein